MAQTGEDFNFDIYMQLYEMMQMLIQERKSTILMYFFCTEEELKLNTEKLIILQFFHTDL